MGTRELENILNEALRYATDHHHEFVTLEHILLALTGEQEASAIIEGCGGEPKRLASTLKKFLGEHCPKVAPELVTTDGSDAWKPSMTLAIHRVVQRAVIQVQSADREEVSGGNLLISLLREDDSHAVYFLQQQGVTRFEAINYFSHGVGRE